MPKEPEKPENEDAGPESGDDVHDRPTFTGAPRPSAPTLTDPAELEDARRRSMGSSPKQEKVTAPPGGAVTAPPREAVTVPPGGAVTVPPGGPASSNALSLVNARAPSVPPPAGDADDFAFDLIELDEATPTATPTRPAGPMIVDRHAAVTAPPAPVSPEQDLRDRLALGDFTGALAVAETILAAQPGHAEALAAVESCRETLRKMYAARIGPLDRVPQVAVPREQMRWLSIDHRAGFVLSLVDGVSTVEMLLDVSGMPELDALRILSELLQQRIITLR